MHNDIDRLLREGKSDREIGLRLGIPSKAAGRRRRALGLPSYLTRADSPSCRNGHLFPENRGFDRNGYVICRSCRREGARRRRGAASEPDEIAISRAVAGDPPERLTRRERTAAVLQLTARAASAREIAERLGCSQRTVHRVRSNTRATRPDGYGKAA